MEKVRTVWLTTNRTCNNSCQWCYAYDKLSCSDMMNIDEAKKLVDSLALSNVETIVLIGGEPTIYPHFFELIEYINSKKIKINIPSNGRKFADKEFAKRISEFEIGNIDISIKGVDKASYLENTKVDGLGECIEAYHNLKELGVSVSASYVISSDSKEEFDKLLKMLVDNQFATINFQFVKPSLSEDGCEESIPLDKMGKFVTYMYNKVKETNLEYVFETSFPLCLIDQSVLDALMEDGRLISCCGITSGHFVHVDEKFRFLPCNQFAQFAYTEESMDVSKFDDELKKLHDSEAYKMFIQKAKSYPTKKCAECEKWDICGGGCFTRWLMIDPNKYVY